MEHRASKRLHEALEALYDRFNDRSFIHPDPLELLYQWDDGSDREIAGLIASSLAYGRVKQILRSASSVLERMKPSPSSFIKVAGEGSLISLFSSFRHRFTTGEELVSLLKGIQRVVLTYGSLQECFMKHLKRGDATVVPALTGFVKELAGSSGGKSSLLPSPGQGSACKRLFLFLRWMVRKDTVDPGCWEGCDRSKLVIPLDTHMHRICRCLGLTDSRHGQLATALKITGAFRELAPADPVRYDFSLTRLGIREECDPGAFFNACGIPWDGKKG
ncbi:MAG: TIGR02757 family protein [Candidatus Eremiobacteraeota bacterium]|nr:TIGR02757 family protein [Candidatus Eremiobacteraeota bacterium]